MLIPYYRLLKIVNLVPGILLAAMIFGWISYVLVLSLDRDPGTSLYAGGMTLTDTLRTHEAVVSFLVDRNKLCNLKILGSIFDSQGVRHTLPNYELTRRQLRGTLGNRLTLKYTIPMPILPAGPARYESAREYICNWTHYLFPITIDDPVIDFEVN